eukprot:494300_1
MFPKDLGKQLKHEDKNNNKPTQSKWFHSYQIPAEPPTPKLKQETDRPRSKSLDDLVQKTIYPPMNPDKKVEWNKLIPHPHITPQIYPPMDPDKKVEWNKLIPHPHITPQIYPYLIHILHINIQIGFIVIKYLLKNNNNSEKVIAYLYLFMYIV